ncbi:MAG TPA: carbonic anhydrase [Myxococcota bacterium]|nr:carbonic anhydrase [Myxococcota bacterium]
MRIVEIVYRYDAEELRARPDSPRAARERLQRGNLDFASLIERIDVGEGRVAQQVVHVDPRELGVRTGGAAPLQRPFAAVLGCADARVPIELVFHEGPNDLFVVRVAGNVLGPDILGSLRYAMQHLGDSVRLIVVLGHSGCGAIGAAVDTYLRPGGYLDLSDQHDLRGIVDGLLAVVLMSARVLSVTYGAGVETRPGYRAALAELSVLCNAALGAFTVQKELERAQVGDRLAAVFGAYVIDTRQIWAPVESDGERCGLAEPPADLAAFRELGRAAALSARIRKLLG